MKRSEVYSWRLDPELKSELEHAARSQETSVSSLLTRIVRGWLENEYRTAGQDEQQLVREQAMKYVGSIRGGDPKRAEEAAKRVKDIIRKKHGRRRSD